MTPFAQIAEHCPDSELGIIRELLIYDILCPVSCPFARGSVGELVFNTVPSPLHWSRQTEWPWALRAADLLPSDIVLDVGSGWSVLKYAMARRCRKVVALECNREFAERTQPTIDAMRKRYRTDISQVVGDVRGMSFVDGCFDKVICVSVLEHMETGHMEALQEMKRVLKPGGRLVLTMDVLINGKQEDDFYLDRENAEKLLTDLGIAEVRKMHPDSLIGARVGDNGTEIIVVMAYWDKPL